MTNHLARAWQLYELRRDKLAVEEAQRHLAEWPDDADAYRLIVHAAARLGDADSAMRSATKAVELAPDWEDAYAALSDAAQKGEQWEVAESAIQEALRLDPEEARYYANYARLLIHRKQYDKALKIVHQGLEHDPEHEFLVFARPLVLWSLDEYDEARHWLREAFTLYPDDSNLHALQGALLVQDEPGQAIAHLMEALRAEPTNQWALENLENAKLQRWLWYATPVLVVGLVLAVLIGGIGGSLARKDQPPGVTGGMGHKRNFRIKKDDVRQMNPKIRRALFPDFAREIEQEERAAQGKDKGVND